MVIDPLAVPLPQASLRKRYFYKLITSLGGMAVGFITTAIVPRALGPQEFGNFNFLTNFFAQVTGFLDMGTSTGFYAKLCQKQKEVGVVVFYSWFVLAASLLMLAAVSLLLLTPAYKWLLPDQTAVFIAVAAVWAILNWVHTIVNQMTDAYGLTIKAEISRLVCRVLGVIVLAGLFIGGLLNLGSYFLFQCLLFLLILAAFFRIIRRGSGAVWDWRIAPDKVREYSRYFYAYTPPLFICSLAALAGGLLDRWLLQVFGGSVQQGFYGFAYGIGAFCFLFASSMQPLLMREFSIAHGNSDIKNMSTLFRRYIPLIYSIAAFFSCFIAVHSRPVAFIIGGDKYLPAVLPLMIMVLYPIHQTYGQLSSSVFLATGQTTLYRNIAVVFVVIGLPLTYFLVAPARLMGAGLGAAGLAIKMLVINILAVNVQLYYNSKYLGLNFWKYAGHQVLAVAFWFLMAFFAHFSAARLGLETSNGWGFLLVSGVIYTIASSAIVWRYPVIAGLDRDGIGKIAGLLLNKLRSR